jgi:hypothetical protein
VNCNSAPFVKMLLTIIILPNEACTLNRTKDLLISIHNPPQLLSIARSPLPSNNHQINNLGFRLNSSLRPELTPYELQRAATTALQSNISIYKSPNLLSIAQSTQANQQTRVWLNTAFRPQLRPELTNSNPDKLPPSDELQ